MNISGNGSYFTDRNEVYGSAAITQQDLHLYGYDHTLYTYDKADVLQRFQDVTLKGGIRNKDENESGINYNPNVQISIFSSQKKINREFIDY